MASLPSVFWPLVWLAKNMVFFVMWIIMIFLRCIYKLFKNVFALPIFEYWKKLILGRIAQMPTLFFSMKKKSMKTLTNCQQRVNVTLHKRKTHCALIILLIKLETLQQQKTELPATQKVWASRRVFDKKNNASAAFASADFANSRAASQFVVT